MKLTKSEREALIRGGFDLTNYKNRPLCVWQCIKNQGRNVFFGLSDKKYRVGDFITYDGTPTKDLNYAYVFPMGQYHLDDPGDGGYELLDYFQLIKVNVTLGKVISKDEYLKSLKR